MSDVMKRIMKAMEEATFCYAKKTGQGFVKKHECQCYINGEINCAAKEERDTFHELYKSLEQQGFTRQQILQEIDGIFKWEESDWIQYNVIK